MIKVKFFTDSIDSEDIVSPATTIEGYLKTKNANLSRVMVMFNNETMSKSDYSLTFNDLTDEDECTITLCAKADCA